MAINDVSLTAGMRSNLFSLQNTVSLLNRTQNRLSSGKKVNSAIDNPASYFASLALNSRASVIDGLKDAMGQAVQTITTADKGIKGIAAMIEQAKGIAQAALSAPTGTGHITEAVTLNSVVKGDTISIEGKTLTAGPTATATVYDNFTMMLAGVDAGDTVEVGGATFTGTAGSTITTTDSFDVTLSADTLSSGDTVIIGGQTYMASVGTATTTYNSFDMNLSANSLSAGDTVVVGGQTYTATAGTTSTTYNSFDMSLSTNTLNGGDTVVVGGQTYIATTGTTTTTYTSFDMNLSANSLQAGDTVAVDGQTYTATAGTAKTTYNSFDMDLSANSLEAGDTVVVDGQIYTAVVGTSTTTYVGFTMHMHDATVGDTIDVGGVTFTASTVNSGTSYRVSDAHTTAHNLKAAIENYFGAGYVLVLFDNSHVLGIDPGTLAIDQHTVENSSNLAHIDIVPFTTTTPDPLAPGTFEISGTANADAASLRAAIDALQGLSGSGAYVAGGAGGIVNIANGTSTLNAGAVALGTASATDIVITTNTTVTTSPTTTTYNSFDMNLSANTLTIGDKVLLGGRTYTATVGTPTITYNSFDMDLSANTLATGDTVVVGAQTYTAADPATSTTYNSFDMDLSANTLAIGDTVVIGGQTYTGTSGLAVTAYNSFDLNLSANTLAIGDSVVVDGLTYTAAAATTMTVYDSFDLNLSANTIANNDTVVVGGQTYTAKANAADTTAYNSFDLNLSANTLTGGDTVVIGGTTYTATTGSTTTTYNNVRVDCNAIWYNPGIRISVGGVIYTAVAGPTAVATEFDVNADVDVVAANLMAKIVANQPSAYTIVINAEAGQLGSLLFTSGSFELNENSITSSDISMGTNQPLATVAINTSTTVTANLLAAGEFLITGNANADGEKLWEAINLLQGFAGTGAYVVSGWNGTVNVANGLSTLNAGTVALGTASSSDIAITANKTTTTGITHTTYNSFDLDLSANTLAAGDTVVMGGQTYRASTGAATTIYNSLTLDGNRLGPSSRVTVGGVTYTATDGATSVATEFDVSGTAHSDALALMAAIQALQPGAYGLSEDGAGEITFTAGTSTLDAYAVTSSNIQSAISANTTAGTDGGARTSYNSFTIDANWLWSAGKHITVGGVTYTSVNGATSVPTEFSLSGDLDAWIASLKSKIEALEPGVFTLTTNGLGTALTITAGTSPLNATSVISSDVPQAITASTTITSTLAAGEFLITGSANVDGENLWAAMNALQGTSGGGKYVIGGGGGIVHVTAGTAPLNSGTIVLGTASAGDIAITANTTVTTDADAFLISGNANADATNLRAVINAIQGSGGSGVYTVGGAGSTVNIAAGTSTLNAGTVALGTASAGDVAITANSRVVTNPGAFLISGNANADAASLRAAINAIQGSGGSGSYTAGGAGSTVNISNGTYSLYAGAVTLGTASSSDIAITANTTLTTDNGIARIYNNFQVNGNSFFPGQTFTLGGVTYTAVNGATNVLTEFDVWADGYNRAVNLMAKIQALQPGAYNLNLALNGALTVTAGTASLHEGSVTSSVGFAANYTTVNTLAAGEFAVSGDAGDDARSLQFAINDTQGSGGTGDYAVVWNGASQVSISPGTATLNAGTVALGTASATDIAITANTTVTLAAGEFAITGDAADDAASLRAAITSLQGPFWAGGSGDYSVGGAGSVISISPGWTSLNAGTVALGTASSGDIAITANTTLTNDSFAAGEFGISGDANIDAASLRVAINSIQGSGGSGAYTVGGAGSTVNVSAGLSTLNAGTVALGTASSTDIAVNANTTVTDDPLAAGEFLIVGTADADATSLRAAINAIQGSGGTGAYTVGGAGSTVNVSAGSSTLNAGTVALGTASSGDIGITANTTASYDPVGPGEFLIVGTADADATSLRAAINALEGSGGTGAYTVGGAGSTVNVSAGSSTLNAGTVALGTASSGDIGITANTTVTYDPVGPGEFLIVGTADADATSLRIAINALQGSGGTGDYTVGGAGSTVNVSAGLSSLNAGTVALGSASSGDIGITANTTTTNGTLAAGEFGISGDANADATSLRIAINALQGSAGSQAYTIGGAGSNVNISAGSSSLNSGTVALGTADNTDIAIIENTTTSDVPLAAGEFLITGTDAQVALALRGAIAGYFGAGFGTAVNGATITITPGTMTLNANTVQAGTATAGEIAIASATHLGPGPLAVDEFAVTGNSSADAQALANLINNTAVITTAGYTATASNGVLTLSKSSADIVAGDVTVSNTAAMVETSVAARSELLDLQEQYNGMRDQLTAVAEDAGYKGKNLLSADASLRTMDVKFEDNTLSVQGFDASAAGLDVTQAAWTAGGITAINADIVKLTNSLSSLQQNSAKLAGNLSIITIRRNFSTDMINTLIQGSDKLTLADANEESSNMLMLQTRQSLSTTALSLSAQAAQAVLKLFQ